MNDHNPNRPTSSRTGDSATVAPSRFKRVLRASDGLRDALPIVLFYVACIGLGALALTA